MGTEMMLGRLTREHVFALVGSPNQPRQSHSLYIGCQKKLSRAHVKWETLHGATIATSLQTDGLRGNLTLSWHHKIGTWNSRRFEIARRTPVSYEEAFALLMKLAAGDLAF